MVTGTRGHGFVLMLLALIPDTVVECFLERDEALSACRILDRAAKRRNKNSPGRKSGISVGFEASTRWA